MGWDKLADTAKSRVWLLRSAIKEDTWSQALKDSISWDEKSTYLTAWLSPLHTRPHVPARVEKAQLSGHKLETKAGLLSRVCGGQSTPSYAAMVQTKETSSCVSGHRDDEALFGRARYLSV